ncbi:MAG: NYN domain-containing protein [Gammaproteobacteria bacterium HGW-Gammaproteobacteria-3]|nr:MAG: NYN domain-containing protein [Gammaproteobacteria bacterium HGW-Gammaproteobacteria-3]
MIDLENCPKQVHQLMENLASYSQVVVCYAHSGARVPLDWIVPLTATVNDNRLKIVKMPNGGKNSADFGITFWAGVLMAQLPENTHFDVVSDDADLDHVVSLLISQQRSAARIGVKKAEAKIMQPQPLPRPPDAVIQEYCLHLAKHNKSRPVKKETLLNSINSKFKNNAINPEAVCDELGRYGAIAVKDNRISYNQQKIEELAAQLEA